MHRAEFRRYKSAFIRAQRDILSGGGSPVLNEAAFPAYATSSPLARFLFWQRIREVIEYLEARGPLPAVMDFGCGGGVMLPFLGGAAQRVVAVDLDLRPLQEMQRHLSFPQKIVVYHASRTPLDRLPEGSFDVILALDVLEHVEDLPGTLGELHRLLAPGGEIIVSGPTENLAYRLGRRLSGAEYSGAYHVRTVYDIRRALEDLMPVTTLASLYSPVPLFRIYRGRRAVQ